MPMEGGGGIWRWAAKWGDGAAEFAVAGERGVYWGVATAAAEEPP